MSGSAGGRVGRWFEWTSGSMGGGVDRFVRDWAHGVKGVIGVNEVDGVDGVDGGE